MNIYIHTQKIKKAGWVTARWGRSKHIPRTPCRVKEQSRLHPLRSALSH